MAGFHTAGPNEALIVSGGGQQPTIKVGGRKFVLPIVQKAQYLSLEVMTLTVNTPKVYTLGRCCGLRRRRGPGEGRSG